MYSHNPCNEIALGKPQMSNLDPSAWTPDKTADFKAMFWGEYDEWAKKVSCPEYEIFSDIDNMILDKLMN